MFEVQWDSENNGVLLVDSVIDNSISKSPRPVYFEELDLLGFNKYWTYPKSDNPLLWAVGRKYYYKGTMVAEAKGGNIFQSPTITITNEGDKLQLKPIDIKKVVENNKKALFVLENEAIDFVDYTHRKFKSKIDFFAAAYSGGKDSQVVLDIVTRVLNPKDFIVVFSDTKMEIPFTYDVVKKTKEEYKKKYPDVRFYTAVPPMDTLEYWKLFGPPSRIHRWCCTVIKTAPFAKLIKDIYKTASNMKDKQPKILVYEGVRAEESVNRSKYSRIRKNIKHLNQINVEIIQFWSTLEVFLYLFLRNIKLNESYRWGLNRVGCAICPFASNWSEHILYNINRSMTDNYLSIINGYTDALGIHKRNDKINYIMEGQWKKRAGGRGLGNNGTMIEFLTDKNQFKAVIKNPRESFLNWLSVVGDILYKEGDNKTMGELKIGSEIFPFERVIKRNVEIIKFDNIGRDIIAQSKIKKVLYKTTYCVHCGACEVECPTGALKVIPEVKIDTKLCSNCCNCVNFLTHGCLVAKSINTTGGNMQEDKIATSKYQTFGMRQNWLLTFLRDNAKWIEINNLGNRQKDSFKIWLKDAEIIDKGFSNITQLGKLLNKIVLFNELFVWEIILVNLYYNSNLIKWYIDSIHWGEIIPAKDLINRLINYDENCKERTANNSILSLLNLFECTPYNNELKIGLIEKEKGVRIIKKLGNDDIHPMSIAYCLYKLSEKVKRKDFTVFELYKDEFEGGPYKLFGISKEKLEKVLRGLQEDKNQILRVDLVADLDNINLREDLNSLDIVEILSKNNE